LAEDSEIPSHVEETVNAIANWHTAHYREAPRVQRFVSYATDWIARPRLFGTLGIGVAAWLAFNVVIEATGAKAPDPFPFPLLSMMVSTVALFVTTMVLIAQRHDDQLATRREQLTLELAILAERKSAKIIALLEQFRRDDPHQSNLPDEVAQALSEPADPNLVLEAIEAAHKNPPSSETEPREKNGKD
jgi:uncharacterized membrane protein